LSSSTVSGIAVVVLLIICALLVALGLQEARTGNLRPLLMAVDFGALGFFIVWFRSRRIP
jgi:hypothetical protein